MNYFLHSIYETEYVLISLKGIFIVKHPHEMYLASMKKESELCDYFVLLDQNMLNNCMSQLPILLVIWSK